LLSSETKAEELALTVMSKAKQLTRCESASLYLIDRETSQLASLALTDSKSEEERIGHATDEIRRPLSQGFAGHAASTGEVINVIDA
jgi:hypothetical protein